METKVLVAYATMHGSTQEIAETVAEVLRERGLTVDLQPAGEVRSLDGYGAVVLGAPLYIYRLHKDGRSFLARHRKALTEGVPIVIFGGGPLGGADEKVWMEVRESLDKELAKFSWLEPMSVELVGGKMDPSKLRFPYNLIPAMKKMPPSDERDWDAIRAWAVSLADRLKEGLV